MQMTCQKIEVKVQPERAYQRFNSLNVSYFPQYERTAVFLCLDIQSFKQWWVFLHVVIKVKTFTSVENGDAPNLVYVISFPIGCSVNSVTPLRIKCNPAYSSRYC